MKFWKRSENLSSQEETVRNPPSEDKVNDPLSQKEAVENTTSEETVKNPTSKQKTVNDPPSQEDQDELLEASGNCLVNKNYLPPWL